MTEPTAKPALIDWEAYRRWFLRGRLFRIAIQSRLLVLTFFGVLLTIAGWSGLAAVFSGTDEPALRRLLEGYRDCPWTAPAAAADPVVAVVRTFGSDANSPGLGRPPVDAYLDPANRLSTPFRQFFDASQTYVGAAFLLLCCVWAAAVWGLFGGAAARSVVVQLAREEAITIRAATGFAARRWKALAAAPLMPVLFVVVLAVPAIFIGLFAKLSLLVAGVLWPIVLLFGLVAAILLVGLAVGWPLMYAAVGAEGSDAFDALSRSYSYVYQRPTHYLLYAISAVVLGFLGLTVVGLFAAAVEGLALWSFSWGSGVGQAERVAAASIGAVSSGEWWGKLFWFWHGVVRLIVLAFAFAFFWTASSAIYLLLRHDVDGAEVGEAYSDDDGSPRGLPPVTTDAAGVSVAAAEPKHYMATTVDLPQPGSTAPTTELPPEGDRS